MDSGSLPPSWVLLSPFCKEENQRFWKSDHLAEVTWAQKAPQLELSEKKGLILSAHLSLEPQLASHPGTFL